MLYITILLLILIVTIIFKSKKQYYELYSTKYKGFTITIKDDKNKKVKNKKIKSIKLIIKNLLKIKKYLVNNIDRYPKYKPYILNIDSKFDENTLIKETTNDDFTAYTVNKGDTMSFCLNSKINNKIHDINILMYVAIHELAHIASTDIGHTDLFHELNDFLLDIAIKLNVYNFINYSNFTTEYCGIYVK